MGKRKQGGHGGHGGGKDKKRQRSHAMIEPGQYGVFASCERNKEVAAAKDMRLMLNAAIEKYYPKVEEDDEEEEKEEKEEKETNTVDIEDEIAKELSELRKNDDRTKAGRNNKDLILREIPIGVESLTFFKLKQPVKPSELIVNLCKDLYQSGEKKGRFVQRLVPIDRSCNATEAEFKKLLKAVIESVVEEKFEGDVEKAKVEFETYNVNLIKRNFDTISRDEFMTFVKEALDAVFGGGWCRLQYKGSLTLLNIYCFKNNIGMSVVSNGDFEKLCKFNVQQIFDRSVREREETLDAGEE